MYLSNNARALIMAVAIVVLIIIIADKMGSLAVVYAGPQ